MTECLGAYEAIKKIFYDDTENQSKELIIYKYNSDLNPTDFATLKTTDSIDNLRPFLLELEIKIKGQTITNINKFRANDYNAKIKLNTKCT